MLLSASDKETTELNKFSTGGSGVTTGAGSEILGIVISSPFSLAGESSSCSAGKRTAVGDEIASEGSGDTTAMVSG
jgi:hypothetical protein